MTEQIETRALKDRRQDLRLASVRGVALSQGSPLDPALRALMEARFGHDFGCVRLHTDDLAAASARALSAGLYGRLAHSLRQGKLQPRNAGGPVAARP
jgi:hypothetical protein